MNWIEVRGLNRSFMLTLLLIATNAACQTTNEFDAAEADDVGSALSRADASKKKCPKQPGRGQSERHCPPPDPAGRGGSAGAPAAGSGMAGGGGQVGGAGGAGNSCMPNAICPLGLAPAAQVSDVVHDAKRNMVYITTRGTNNDGAVLRWDPVRRQYLTPLLAGGLFLGLDISPDQDHLIVADAQSDATHNWVHVIDLASGATRKLEFPLAFMETGTFSVVFLDDETFVVTTNFAGSGWTPMRKVSLADGSVTELASRRQSSMVSPSANAPVFGVAESNISSGPVTLYDWSNDTVRSYVETNWFTYEVCVRRDAGQFAVPTYGGLYIYGSDSRLLTTLGTYAFTFPIGCAYSPTSDVLYLAWTDYNQTHASIDAYDATTLQPLRNLDAKTGIFGNVYNGSFNQGRLRMSRDGKLLMATTGQGVAIYQVD